MRYPHTVTQYLTFTIPNFNYGGYMGGGYGWFLYCSRVCGKLVLSLKVLELLVPSDCRDVVESYVGEVIEEILRDGLLSDKDLRKIYERARTEAKKLIRRRRKSH